MATVNDGMWLIRFWRHGLGYIDPEQKTHPATWSNLFAEESGRNSKIARQDAKRSLGEVTTGGVA